jgi:hypothetical protein
MTALSGGKKVGKRLLFSATVQTDIKGIGDNFKGLFDELKGIRQTFGPNLQHGENPWPKACNIQFLHTAKHVYDHYPDIDAFYYFEPDNLPLTADWFDQIAADYEKQGKPFYGVSASYIERREGVDAFLDGNHMIGTGIYPRDAYARVKGYAKIEQDQPGRPWDALTRDEVNPQCHFTNLIFNAHNSRGFMEDEKGISAVFKPNLEKKMERRTVTIPKEAVVFHGCKDSSLRLLIGQKLGIPQTEPLTFCHAGDFGDIIYALPAIKARGGGNLHLCERRGTREPMTEARSKIIVPLLWEQSYLKDIAYADEGYYDFDFRQFRAVKIAHSNLAEDQANWIGASVDLTEPWLAVSEVKKGQRVILNRTQRYHNDFFPWQEITASVFNLFFIGTNGELADFIQAFGKIEGLPTPTLLDAARVIAGSKLFIGNQSVCFAIAEGLKHPRIQETWVENMDCLFEGDENAQYCYLGNVRLPEFAVKRNEAPVPAPDWITIMKHPQFEEAINKLIDVRLEALLK